MDSKIRSLLHELSNGHGEIIMDTASLMEVDRLNYMVENYKPLLMQNRLSIIIPGVVCQELVRHLTSDNTEKKKKANEALKVIRNNGEMFTVESAEYSSDEVRKAFADREILLRLSSVRATRRQLLITNDRKLSRDAYNLTGTGAMVLGAILKGTNMGTLMIIFLQEYILNSKSIPLIGFKYEVLRF